MNLEEICEKFGICAMAKKEITKGIINNTSVVVDKSGNQYILQEINTHVFKNVDGLMRNIELVTDFIRNKIHQEGGDEKTGTLNLLKSNGKSYVEVFDELGDKHYFRMYDYISSASTFDEASDELLYEAGIGFGRFQRQLADFPAEMLYESIPDFHNTLARFEAFEQALHNAKTAGKQAVYKAVNEIKFAYENVEYAGLIMNALNSGKIPYRVVHNDTKLNNVMLDNVTHKAVCLVDLDTIMPGSLLFDYGDGIRYSANNGKEDDLDLRNVSLSTNKFRQFTKGFLKETASSLTEGELELMPYAPIVIAYELGLRFLTDYLNGNVYFKCDGRRPDHNLERAKAQFKLASNMQENLPVMTEIILEMFEKYKNRYIVQEQAQQNENIKQIIANEIVDVKGFEHEENVGSEIPEELAEKNNKIFE